MAAMEPSSPDPCQPKCGSYSHTWDHRLNRVEISEAWRFASKTWLMTDDGWWEMWWKCWKKIHQISDLWWNPGDWWHHEGHYQQLMKLDKFGILSDLGYAGRITDVLKQVVWKHRQTSLEFGWQARHVWMANAWKSEFFCCHVRLGSLWLVLVGHRTLGV